MLRVLRRALALGLVAALAATSATWAVGAEEAGKEGEEAAPVLTPEQQAAQDMLERYRKEMAAKRDMDVFVAANRAKAGETAIKLGHYNDAKRQFEEALRLDPNNKDAQKGLEKARALLGLEERKFGDLAAEYARQQQVALELRKTQLMNMFENAVQLFEEEKYAQAVEEFTRASSQAKYLAARIDTADIAREAEVYIQRALRAAEEKRKREELARREEAAKEAERIQLERRSLLEERTQALMNQAKVLFDQHRYEECRKVCDEILLKDPTNGAAETLRAAATEASRTEAIDRAVNARRVETERHWQETRAMSVPQAELVYMPRDRFEEVRSRAAQTAIGGEVKKAEPWEAAIREAMNKKISFDFVETPLQDVISFISGLVDVTIVLDNEAIRDQAPVVTLRVSDMRLESALRWVLKLVALKYTLRDEAIFVSKADQIYDKPVLRMYDVTDLTIDIKNFQGRQQALASDGGYSSTGSSGSGGGDDSLGEDFFGDEDDDVDEDDRLTGETLVEFIKKTIAPGTWDESEVDVAF